MNHFCLPSSYNTITSSESSTAFNSEFPLPLPSPRTYGPDEERKIYYCAPSIIEQLQLSKHTASLTMKKNLHVQGLRDEGKASHPRSTHDTQHPSQNASASLTAAGHHEGPTSAPRSHDLHSTSSSEKEKAEKLTLQYQLENADWRWTENIMKPQNPRNGALNLVERMFEMPYLNLKLDGESQKAEVLFHMKDAKGHIHAGRTTLHVRTGKSTLHVNTENKEPQILCFCPGGSHKASTGQKTPKCEAKSLYDTLHDQLTSVTQNQILVVPDIDGSAKFIKYQSGDMEYRAQSDHNVCNAIEAHHELKKKGDPPTKLESILTYSWEVEYPVADHPQSKGKHVA